MTHTTISIKIPLQKQALNNSIAKVHDSLEFLLQLPREPALFSTIFKYRPVLAAIVWRPVSSIWL